MKNYLFVFALALMPLSACGYSVMDAAEDISGSDNGLANGSKIGNSVTSTGTFTKVQSFGPDNLVFVVGETYSIKAEGNTEAVETLRYKLDDGAIRIGRTKGKWFGDSAEPVTITITAPYLSKATLAGSGDFTAEKMTADAMELVIAGSGSINIGALNGRSLSTKIAGSGEAVLAGKVDSAIYKIAGAGTINASKLTSIDAKVSIAGSGDLKLNATGTVDVSIAGSGDVDVVGGAKCKTSKMGSGNVNCS